jgi:hypothetical protein
MRQSEIHKPDQNLQFFEMLDLDPNILDLDPNILDLDPNIQCTV